MKNKFPVFALGALMLFVVSCEKETDGIDNKEEQGTENTDTFSVEAIDLGLSVKWANCNVGANYAEGYGDFYEPNSSIPWGLNWRLPSYLEIVELHENCTWTWSEQRGINGMLVTGPSGKSIFLPAAGAKNEEVIEFQGTIGTYWGSIREGGSVPIFTFGNTGSFINDGGNTINRSIRPVTEK